MIIFILAARNLVAQGDLVIYEGTQMNYKVGFNDGNKYAWEIMSNVNPPQNASPGDFGFITDPSLSDVMVQWNVAGTYFVTVTESDVSGCSNKKALAIQVQPNNRSVGFDAVASAECYNLNGNPFNLALAVMDNNGAPLSETYFPLQVEFTVNGAPQSQLLSYNDQQLLITDAMFSALPDQNTAVEVKLTSVTDVKFAPVQPGTNGTHLRTINAIPVIEFTEEIRLRYLKRQNEVTAYSGIRAEN